VNEPIYKAYIKPYNSVAGDGSITTQIKSPRGMYNLYTLGLLGSRETIKK
jgi:hypothetical protein